MPHLSGPRRYFFHHSNRVLSLQCYPSLAGKTVGTRIDKYRPLVMPLVRKCKEQHALAHLYNRLARRLFCSPPCGSCSVFEVAHTVYKFAPNMFSFRVWVSRAKIIHHSLLIINFYCLRIFCKSHLYIRAKVCYNKLSYKLISGEQYELERLHP